MASSTVSTPRIGLALSGGGFRAAAFSLGALRALHDLGVLERVEVVSGISGGSLLAAMWAYGPREFDAFDRTATDIITGGLQLELARRAASPFQLLRRTSPHRGGRHHVPGHPTEALARALAARDFGARNLDDITHSELRCIISATDLASGNAVRFSSAGSSCSAYGQLVDPVTVADAVAASCAYPVLLPPLRRTYQFQPRDGATQPRTLRMTDGGVYDNLGLSPLMPGRSRAHTSQVFNPDYLIAVDAGHGRSEDNAPGGLYRLPLVRSFDITHTKTQDGTRSQLHTIAEHGELRGFVHTYLGMKDERLPIPIADFVRRHESAAIGTSFRALTADQLNTLSVRAEQLTRVLIDYYVPELPRASRP